jgi:hypothetical protein
VRRRGRSVSSSPVPRLAPLLAAALLAVTALAGCDLKSEDSGGDPAERVGEGVSSNDESGLEALGFPTTATRDTIRVPGNDPAADAAGVASALYPAATPNSRPPAVALVDSDQWQAGVAAGVLSGNPLRAPILLTSGDDLPAVTQATLDRLKPGGQRLAKNAQVLLVGDKPPAPEKYRSGAIEGGDPYEIANSVDRFQTAAAGRPSRDVMVVSGEDPAYAMPAAAYAARASVPVLFVKKGEVPGPTREAINRHQKPKIYVLGPPTVIGPGVETELKKLGKVTRIGGDAKNPVESAVEFTIANEGSFGWNARQPGRNYSLVNTSRPLDAAAAAPLGANGVFAPMLVTDQADAIPPALLNYITTVQPGYEQNDPSAGVFNRIWILGNSDAVSPQVQGRLDEFLRLVPVDTAPDEEQ